MKRERASLDKVELAGTTLGQGALYVDIVYRR